MVRCLSVYSVIVGMAGGGWFHCIYAQSGSNFLLSIPDPGMVLPTSRVGFPCSETSLEMPHRHAHGCVAQVFQNSIKEENTVKG